MRIAYIAPYQGPTLVQRRPIVRNRSLAATVKIEVISELLRRNGHEVEIFSQGEVIEHRVKYYPAFPEPQLFDAKVPIHYASAIPLPLMNGLWSSLGTLRKFRARHREAPFDAVIIYNFKQPQMHCARYASRRLGLPVLIEYEDDAFVNVFGKSQGGFREQRHWKATRETIALGSGCIGVSPHLLSQVPSTMPSFLLRGVISSEIVSRVNGSASRRSNRVVFSGTLARSKGVEPLITAWGALRPTGWELHIAGGGALEPKLREQARDDKSIVFHGVLDRTRNAELLTSSKIGINPHELSDTPGNVFAFKIVEYLAAGLHVISTPMGPVEPEIDSGIRYIADNKPETIAEALKEAIGDEGCRKDARHAAAALYGPDAVARSLGDLLSRVIAGRRGRNGAG